MVAFYRALSETHVCNAFVDLLILFNYRKVDLAGFHAEAKLLFYLCPDVYSLFVSSWEQLGATPLPKAHKPKSISAHVTPPPNPETGMFLAQQAAATRVRGPTTLTDTIAAEFSSSQAVALAKRNTRTAPCKR